MQYVIDNAKPLNIPSNIFRAYDIRGIYDETLTADTVYQIGLALGTEAKSRGITQIITARDARISGPVLLIALQQGLLATGCNVIDIGTVPTPVLYYATHVLPTNSGIMLTGSHNPAEYNGLKIVLQGETLAEDEIQKLYLRIKNQDFSYGSGELSVMEVRDQYLNSVSQNINIERKLKVVVDCGNGITADVVPQLFRNLGCEVIELFCEIDGNFPNHEPDPSQPKNLIALIQAVQDQQADVGLAFDGDGDRLGLVTNRGTIIWPDRQMMLFAQEILRAQPHKNIIFDVKCSRHLAEVIRANHGEPIMWKTGHSLIKAKMAETDAIFAGEMSGHLFFNDRWYGFDDGIYAGCRLLEILASYSDDIDTIFKAFPDSVNTAELKIPIRESEKFYFMSDFMANAKFANANIVAIDGLRVDFGDGWGLIRASNTSPCLVLRFEASTTAVLEKIQEQFRQQLLALDENITITF